MAYDAEPDTTELEALLAEGVWRHHNGLDPMDPFTNADPLYQRAKNFNASRGDAFEVTTPRMYSSWWLVLLAAVAVVGAIWGLGL